MSTAPQTAPGLDTPDAPESSTVPGPVVGFDLDMTLVDSSEGIAATLRAVLGEVGITITAADTWPYAGMPLELILAGLAPGTPAAQIETLTARYRQLYPSLGIASVTAFPAAAAALAAPSSHGGRSVVVSAKHTPNVHRVLSVTGLAGAVDDVSGDLFAEQKGLKLAELGATAYVGDHPGDVRAARVAGAVSVVVTTGSHDAAALLEAGADVVLASLDEFPEWLTSHAADLRNGKRAVPVPR